MFGLDWVNATCVALFLAVTGAFAYILWKNSENWP